MDNDGRTVYARVRKRDEPLWDDMPEARRNRWDEAAANVSRVVDSKPAWWLRIVTGQATADDFEAERRYREEKDS